MHVQEMMRVHQDARVFTNFFHMGAKISLFPAIFSHPSSNKTSSTCFLRSGPANVCPYKFRSRNTTGSSMFDHDLGHLCRG